MDSNYNKLNEEECVFFKKLGDVFKRSLKC